MSGVFDALTPACILTAVEEELSVPLTGLTAPLPSYINRVYELATQADERLIVKFYRPGRWQQEALAEEHQFLLDCDAAEIPVVAPMVLQNGSTLGCWDGIYFTLFPKRSGREMNLHTDEDWRRLGSMIGRMHAVGMERDTEHRLVMHPESTTLPERDQLLAGGWMSSHMADRFKAVVDQVVEWALPLFEDAELHRIHGDCHRANVLERPGEGLMLIDFDDMVMGPAVQDFWLMLPGHAHACGHELTLMLEGYEPFVEFDDRQLGMIELLRAMRMIYFLAWCSTQADDYRFQSQFPEWGSEHFWQREVADLEQQVSIIEADRNRIRGGGNEY